MSFLFHEQSSDNFFALLGLETGLRLLAWFSAFSQSPIRPALCVTRNKKSHAQSLNSFYFYFHRVSNFRIPSLKKFGLRLF